MSRKFDDFVRVAREEEVHDKAQRRAAEEVEAVKRRELNQRALDTSARAQQLILELHEAATTMQYLAGRTVTGWGKKFKLKPGAPDPPPNIHVVTRRGHFGNARGWLVYAPAHAPMATTGHRASGLAACTFFVPLRGTVEVQASQAGVKSPDTSTWMPVASFAQQGYWEWVQYDTEGRSCTLHCDAEEHITRFLRTVAQYVAILERPG